MIFKIKDFKTLKGYKISKFKISRFRILGKLQDSRFLDLQFVHDFKISKLREPVREALFMETVTEGGERKEAGGP